MKQLLTGLLCCVAGLIVCCRVAGAANVPETLELGECGQVLATTPFLDYRYRSETPYSRGSYQDNWRAHTHPAIQRLRAGEITRPVIADLDFTLRHWPNHQPALQALIDYAVRGGMQYRFLSPECYFRRARGMVPDDVSVVVLHGLYYKRTGNLVRAGEVLQEALAMDSSSIDAHYNLGLVYAGLGKYDKALEHAHVAYAAGYPLPGLRNKLIEAKVWTEPQTPGAASASPPEKK